MLLLLQQPAAKLSLLTGYWFSVCIRHLCISTLTEVLISLMFFFVTGQVSWETLASLEVSRIRVLQFGEYSFKFDQKYWRIQKSMKGANCTDFQSSQEDMHRSISVTVKGSLSGLVIQFSLDFSCWDIGHFHFIWHGDVSHTSLVRYFQTWENVLIMKPLNMLSVVCKCIHCYATTTAANVTVLQLEYLFLRVKWLLLIIFNRDPFFIIIFDKVNLIIVIIPKVFNLTVT